MIWEKAKSEPFEKQDDTGSLELKALSVKGIAEIDQAPMIVSSDMTASGMS